MIAKKMVMNLRIIREYLTKKLVLIGIAALLLVFGISGCIESSIETVEITDSNLCYITDRTDKPIILDVKGSNCTIKVTEQTNLTKIIISGSNCELIVSRQHSFTSELIGSNNIITYYD